MDGDRPATHGALSYGEYGQDEIQRDRDRERISDQKRIRKENTFIFDAAKLFWGAGACHEDGSGNVR